MLSPISFMLSPISSPIDSLDPLKDIDSGIYSLIDSFIDSLIAPEEPPIDSLIDSLIDYLIIPDEAPIDSFMDSLIPDSNAPDIFSKD